jgi:hypothetical protein
MAEAAEEVKISPINTADFGADTHRVNRFSADVPGSYTIKDLENPDAWVNVAKNMSMGCEVRCLADDMSFVAYGVCTFVQGSIAKVKINSFHKMDLVDPDSMGDAASDFEVKLRGPKKWSIVNKRSGDVVKEGIDTQLNAMRELEDYRKALRR